MIQMESYEPIATYAESKNYSISMIRKLVKKGLLKSRKFKRRVYIWTG